MLTYVFFFFCSIKSMKLCTLKDRIGYKLLLFLLTSVFFFHSIKSMKLCTLTPWLEASLYVWHQVLRCNAHKKEYSTMESFTSYLPFSLKTLCMWNNYSVYLLYIFILMCNMQWQCGALAPSDSIIHVVFSCAHHIWCMWIIFNTTEVP